MKTTAIGSCLSSTRGCFTHSLEATQRFFKHAQISAKITKAVKDAFNGLKLLFASLSLWVGANRLAARAAGIGCFVGSVTTLCTLSLLQRCCLCCHPQKQAPGVNTGAANLQLQDDDVDTDEVHTEEDADSDAASVSDGEDAELPSANDQAKIVSGSSSDGAGASGSSPSDGLNQTI